MNYIAYPGNIDIRRGGPSGYIANLEKGLNKINPKQDVSIISKRSNVSSQKSESLKKILFNSIIGKNNFMASKFGEKKFIKYRDIAIKQQLKEITFTENDIVHLHSVLDYNKFSEHNLKSKLILTPHTPESISDECVNLIKNNFNNMNLDLKSFKHKIKELEKRAFEMCEYFIFPSKESMEIYSTFIEDFDLIMKDKKIYYNLTGCQKLSHKLTKEEFRKKHNIKKDAFVISYIGRHNHIKGFDILKEVAKEVYKVDKEIVFISGGTGDIKSESNNFIEFGWTDDPGSIVNASDLFILPNRNTYFDLVLLEVLSLGIPVLASNTGGNKTVADMTNGIKLFENGNVAEVIEKVLEFKNDSNILNEMGNNNSICYNTHFTLEKFAERYSEILMNIKKV
ncbi:TPA: glycosyltransferase family 4 protein [Bacillus cereus]|uniref:glycosyltransferase family 4 protein n=1 Tax=Bacillus wiedmannii TaxID=1890302 RepID=UPI00086AC78C|nr:glycosyltransferase family 4 protein [Bacillus wiedmannii]MDM5270237.1 glycosyltransferase family 4 protein [Bacillus wiedmannii]SCN41107.1 Glycosyltransferase [Bacillus wiedmannii]HDX9671101.1 glycosyltransferase family 4 protein [Bacillus cereus]